MSDTDLLIGAMIVVGLMIAIGLYRVYAGPTVFDRLVAIALVSVNGVVVLVLLGMTFGRAAYFLDIALGFALLAFLLPIALGRYFEDRDDGTSRDGLPSVSSRPQPKGVVPHGLYAERARVQQRRERARRSGVAHGEEDVAQVAKQGRVRDRDGAGSSASSPTRQSRNRRPGAPGYAGPGGAGPQGPRAARPERASADDGRPTEAAADDPGHGATSDSTGDEHDRDATDRDDPGGRS